jgi:hypothetical protein
MGPLLRANLRKDAWQFGVKGRQASADPPCSRLARSVSPDRQKTSTRGPYTLNRRNGEQIGTPSGSSLHGAAGKLFGVRACWGVIKMTIWFDFRPVGGCCVPPFAGVGPSP